MKITATIKEASAMTGLGRTKLYEAIQKKELSSTLVGRRRLVNVDSLRAFVGAE